MTSLNQKNKQTAYISHPVCLLHEMSQNHPEAPTRILAVENQLKSTGLMDDLEVHEAPAATIEQVQRAHDKSYIKDIFEHAPKEGMRHLDPDTSMNPHTLEAALRAAGAGVLATDLVLSGKAKRSFCNVRPPGHHAEHNRAMGFCFFNSVAIAAMHALEKHNLERVAIVDFDVHHGNGTEDILSNEDRVIFCSSYQHPYYPGYAGKSIKSKVVNVPLAAGTGGDLFRAAVKSQWLPELIAFEPELIIISAGFDGHADDHMGGFNLQDDDYKWVTQEVCDLADKYSEGRVVSMLEGGYDLPSLGRAAAEHVQVLMDLNEKTEA